ncbi:hypothetical protein FQN57_000942 [Myotisia sp. PD_48]|nr:hypothetical protein FQN57_000942 [Myotisia sp. PD_48]
MPTNAVIERRNKQIQDAIEGLNFKQALQLCEKRIKKGEDTPFLKAWRANILVGYSDDAHRQRGIAETVELCTATPPITDLEAINMLQNTLSELGGLEDTSRTLWQNAALAKPQDADIQLNWFHLASKAGDWKSAQKAAMALQNNFPKQRQYYFWAIFMCYLIAKDPRNADNERKMFGLLAYRMISKAASNVPVNPKESIPARAIHALEELSLLTKVYELGSRHSELIELLNSQHLGINSSIAQGDWSLVRSKLSALEAANLWDQALAFTTQLLTLPESITAESKPDSKIEEKDDWKVWRLLLLATEKLADTENFEKTAAFISTYRSKRPASRNAQLAKLELLFQGKKGSLSSTDTLLAECLHYFDDNCTKIYCFNDLKGYLDYLGKLDSKNYVSFKDAMLKKIRQYEVGHTVPLDRPRLVASINWFKFRYAFQTKFDKDDNSLHSADIFFFDCLTQYRDAAQTTNVGVKATATIEAEPVDDLLLLAATSLIHLNQDDIGSIAKPVLIQVAAILEYLLLKSPHNYEALLLLLRTHLLLGTGSLALMVFSKLSVKQMQYETVAHNLFTRLSTIHPHAAPSHESLEKKDYDPQTALRQALIFYRNAVSASTFSRSVGFEHGSYTNLEESIQLYDGLNQSLCRRMWALEARRIQRLVGGPSTSQYDQLVADQSPLLDQRSFAGFPNCEAPGQTCIEEHMRLGPLPGDVTVKAMAMTDSLFNVLTRSAGNTSPRPELSQHLNLDLKSAGKELTPSEIENASIHLLLLKIVSVLNEEPASPSKSSSAGIEELMSQVESFLSNKNVTLSSDRYSETISLTPSAWDESSSPEIPSWLFFHSSFLLLETLKALLLFVSFANNRRKSKTFPSAILTEDRLEALKYQTKVIAASVKFNAKEMKRHLSTPGVLGCLVDTATHYETKEPRLLLEKRKELKDFMGSAHLELFCGSLMESWEEALDGLISTCSPLT